MKNFTTKQDYVDSLNSVEANSFLRELHGTVFNAALTPDLSDNNQFKESARRLASAGGFYTCSGSANTYTLAHPSNYVLPTSYSLGMQVRFDPSATNTGASTVRIGSLSPVAIKNATGTADVISGSLVPGRKVTLLFDGTYFRLVHLDFSSDVASSSALGGGVIQSGGRLSLNSSSAYSLADATGNTIYYVPEFHNQVSLWDGTSWKQTAISTPSVAIPAVAGTVYDIFGYLSSGSMSLEAVAWASTSTRAVSLTTTDGILTKTGDASRRYLGSVATGSGLTAVQDTSSRRLVYTYMDRKQKPASGSIPNDSWYSNSATTWRASNNNTTYGEGRVEYLCGLSTDRVRATLRNGIGRGDSGIYDSCTGLDLGVHIDSTSGTPTFFYNNTMAQVSSTGYGWAYRDHNVGITYTYVGGYGPAAMRSHKDTILTPGLGLHYFQQMEKMYNVGGTKVGVQFGGYTQNNLIIRGI